MVKQWCMFINVPKMLPAQTCCKERAGTYPSWSKAKMDAFCIKQLQKEEFLCKQPSCDYACEKSVRSSGLAVIKARVKRFEIKGGSQEVVVMVN